MIELIKKSLLHENTQNGYVISNFPKNSKQADLFLREIGNVSFVLYLYCDTASLMKRAQEANVGDINQIVLQKKIAHATRDVKMSLGKFISKVENVSDITFV